MNTLPATAPPAPLRIIQHPLARLLLLGAPLFMFMATYAEFMDQFVAQPVLRIAAVVAMMIAAAAIYVAFVRFIERRPVSELALGPLVKELGIGLLVGCGLYAGCVGILILLGIYRIDGFNPVSYMVPEIAAALGSGFFEELVFRAVLFRVVEEWLGSWVSLAISSFVFGFLHLINPEATITGAIFITVEAGILLAAAYMVTRRLWLSIGFHMGWNYTQSAVFSGIVSGNAPAPGLIRPTIEGPDLLTGGQFGIEASLTAFGLCTATGIVLLVMAVRRGHVMPGPWQRQPKGACAK
ncbi:CPBP family intramembrane glutamic endopeptidase [Sandarakinorhabdus rubra]|uniref:CPBP family intramembrane glutamic endopeptidase n=1 Tax=Sandarakinorhabdus rubra TaxID=2672568 RepID=UPI0013DB9301|nr:CPBP family intramembrane glutamic endopeptidase [Sandarakinorhabdus rubra]